MPSEKLEKQPKQSSMILTQCAFCAADLGLSLGKKCGRCSTRYCGPDWATLDDVREAVTTLEDLAPITRRVLGCKHPTMVSIELSLRKVRGKARAMALSPAEVERLPPAEKRAVKALHAAQLRNSK